MYVHQNQLRMCQLFDGAGDSKALGNVGPWTIRFSFARHQILQHARKVSSYGNNKAIGTF